MTETNNNPECVPENVKQTARELADYIVHHMVGTRKRKPPSKHAETLQRTTEEMYHRHEILFSSMAQKLDVAKDNAYATFKNVADEIFTDGKYNWGRIVSVYAFGACLAVHCYNSPVNPKDENAVRRIALFVGNYVANSLSGWIHANGGWDAFDDYFPKETSYEDTIWKGLVITALGLGALATVVAVR